jgi:hypothetical protein
MDNWIKWIYIKLLSKDGKELTQAYAQYYIRDVVMGNNFISRYRKGI